MSRVTHDQSAQGAHGVADPRITAAWRAGDIVRQVAVISAVVFALIAAWVGVGGAGGTPVQDLQDGALDASSTYLAPARSAFSIWSVIYTGLIAYAIWQAFPRQRATARQRGVGWWIAGTVVLNGLWLVTAQYATLELTVAAIVVLLVVLGLTFRRVVVTKRPQSGLLDSVLIDGVTGLHLGWVTLATVANITAWLTVTGAAEWEAAADAWGVAVLIVVAIIGVAVSWASGWRVTPPFAMAWGVFWIAVARLTGEPPSAAIGIAAAVVAGILVVIPGLLRVVTLLRQSGD